MIQAIAKSDLSSQEKERLEEQVLEKMDEEKKVIDSQKNTLKELLDAMKGASSVKKEKEMEEMTEKHHKELNKNMEKHKEAIQEQIDTGTVDTQEEEEEGNDQEEGDSSENNLLDDLIYPTMQEDAPSSQDSDELQEKQESHFDSSGHGTGDQAKGQEQDSTGTAQMKVSGQSDSGGGEIGSWASGTGIQTAKRILNALKQQEKDQIKLRKPSISDFNQEEQITPQDQSSIKQW